MRDITYYTPNDIPSEVLAYNETVKQLGIGKSGKAGLLKIILIKSSDKTLIKEQISEAPLHLQKAYICDQNKEGDYPISEMLSKKVLSLPMHTELDNETQNYIIRSLLEAVGKKTASSLK